MKEENLSQWLKGRREEEHLSLRQVATKVGVSHQTIAGLTNGKKALPTTIKKLAKAFGGDHHQRIALEDKLLCLAGYRTERPEEELSEALAQLMDKAKGLSESRIKIMNQIADLLLEEDST